MSKNKQKSLSNLFTKGNRSKQNTIQYSESGQDKSKEGKQEK